MRRRAAAATDEAAHELARMISRARRRVWNVAARRLEDRGESIFSWVLLVNVVRHGAASQRELAELTAQHPAGVCRALDDLERRGLVRRERDRRDRRRVRVAPTLRGQARYRKLFPEMVVAVDEAFAALSAAERAQLRVLLGKLLVDDELGEPRPA
jgi:DNA-binding MarR family transcriptional regulator